MKYPIVLDAETVKLGCFTMYPIVVNIEVTKVLAIVDEVLH